MYTGNPHQDRNPFKSFTGGFQQGWEDRRPPFHGGGAIPMPKDTMEREGTPAIPMPEATWQKPAPWQGDAPWKKGPLYGGGRFVNPDPFNANPKQFVNPPPEKFWNNNFPNEPKPFDPNMIQLLNTGAHAPLNPSGTQLAELTQEQMDFMGSPYNSPAFGVSKEDLWNRTKGMEKKGFFGWGAQEPTTQQEFNDYYNRLLQGEQGDKGAYWIT